MITDPFFYWVAIPAVLCFGMAKGGMGAAFGLVAVPLMALAVPPLQAAAILLPILLVMDVFAVRSFWREWDMTNLRLTLPGAMLGILVGALTFRFLNDDAIRLMLGLISIAFVANYLLDRHGAAKQPTWARGTWWGSVSGFTSFGIHSGGPPISVFVLPQRLPKRQLMATFAVFFAVLGQFSVDNAMTSLALVPIAPLGVWLGVWLLDRIDESLVYRLSYFGLALLGFKLTYDGIKGVFG